ncbi:MAG: aldo/keto reductase [Candidatus Aminicenantes bacterium]|nr:aldo/keto reductase [Candidatus Aminicenantes bacterium]
MKRRSFIQTSVAGLAGIGAKGATGAGRRLFGMSEEAAGGKKFITRKLGKTGYVLPVVSMGVMNSDNPDLVRAALDGGLIHLDTANGYQRGTNEAMIGKVLVGRPRDSYVIATKVPGVPRDRKTGLFSPETTAETFLTMFDTSLKRLGLEYVDILYLHNVQKRESVLFEPLLQALQKVKKEGKARFIGVSTHAGEPEVIRAVLEGKVHDVVLSGYNFRKNNLAELDAAIADAVKAGIGIVAMKTLAGGYWDEERQRPINVKAALKWALNNPNITTAIPGMTTFEQLTMDLEVARDITLTPQEITDLKQDTKTGGLYCQQCSRCLPQCPRGLPIPTLMRGYMYAQGYRNMDLAKDVVAEAGVAGNPCGNCEGCAVTCAMRFDIKSRVTSVSALA